MDDKLSIILWYEGVDLAVCTRPDYKFSDLVTPTDGKISLMFCGGRAIGYPFKRIFNRLAIG